MEGSLLAAPVSIINQSILYFRKLKERRLKENEHRVIRRLQKIADRKKEEEDAVKREKERLINKQKAVTGEYDDEETTSAKAASTLKRK